MSDQDSDQSVTRNAADPTRIEKPTGGGDEFDRYVETAVALERRMWEGRVDAARHETRAVREQNERLMQILGGVMALLPPPPMESSGQTWIFKDPDANRTLRELRARIAAIAESVHVLRNAQIMAAMAVKKSAHA